MCLLRRISADCFTLAGLERYKPKKDSRLSGAHPQVEDLHHYEKRFPSHQVKMAFQTLRHPRTITF